MNDLERDLRSLLTERASGAGAPRPDVALVRRARRRQAATALAGVVAVCAIVAGIAVSARTFAGSRDGTPADELGPVVETTVNGVTIAHPRLWQAVDPVAAGVVPETETLPRLILLMTDADTLTPEAISCPGLAGEGRADGVVMTIQERPLALAGEGSAPWPVELVPLAEPGDVGPSGCFPGWTFLRGSWTTGGRSFEARVGLGPDLSVEGRGALEAAFASLRFDPIRGEPEAAVIAAGTAAGEGWELVASRDAGGLQLGLGWQDGGGGLGGFGDEQGEIQLASHVFGEGELRQVVAFGGVPAAAVRVEITGPGEGRIVDVPDPIDARWNAVLVTGEAGGAIAVRVYDAEDQLVASARVDAEMVDPVVTPLPEPDEEVFHGRTNDCAWTLARWSEGPDRERLRLVSRKGAPLVELLVDTSSGAPPLQLASFDCPTDDSDAVLVFGVATEEVADVRWTGPLGSDGGPPGCVDSTLPAGLCVVLNDLPGPGEAIALDANGTEIGRQSYGWADG